MVSMSLVTTSPKTENEAPLNSMDNNDNLQIVVHSPPFTLPDGWLVEQRLRRRSSDPNRVDRYYIEPHTGQKFRSLISVQRYLSDESRDYLPTKRMISENDDTIFIKSRKRKFCRPASDFEGGLTEENGRRATPKLLLKSGSGKRSAPSVRSYEKPVEESFSVAEDETILKPIQSLRSEKTNSRKKIKTREDNRASINKLDRPPTKVSWVLSGPGGFWNPFLDDSIVPTSEKAKWSKAFSISINEGVTN